LSDATTAVGAETRYTYTGSGEKLTGVMVSPSHDPVAAHCSVVCTERESRGRG